jgi:hypothetical protein
VSALSKLSSSHASSTSSSRLLTCYSIINISVIISLRVNGLFSIA